MSDLKVANLSLEVGTKEILKDVSAEMKCGELVGLIGPNGAGKSSLLKAILGLQDCVRGEVMLEGRDLNSLSIKERSKLFAYAAQGAPVHWPLTAEYIVGLGRAPHLNPWQRMGVRDLEIVEEALRKTDCTHLKEQSVTTLSGGEKARVLLARALASDTPYLFADEPVASLDPAHQLQVMDILKNEAEAGKGVMVVLHDLGLALRYCDRLILLHEGKTIGQGSAEEILSDENLDQVFGVQAERWKNKGRDFLIVHNLDKGVA
ncbi:ABC transporter ATP-binding protein [Kordiimonas laminariae]|uniref:ABC transporter ATP-binding protein n=1 Tax=Kordiimonas laminariae TaxID=2917717 RepID=UPI001FF28371|nr:ABC transporter ATP-binding protein [Kordiimonas laminariae]MCK0071078.1 ABC transporter ATP-binding protein [Kordiimonas laminariae]